jgi:hypothetical protein
MFYSKCVEICEDFTPDVGDKKLAVASQQRTISPENFFYQTQHDCPPPTLLA